jgi:hypothetical protein
MTTCRMMVGLLVMSCVLWSLGAPRARAAGYVQVALPLKQLPEEHDYQKALRAGIAALTVKDLDIVHGPITDVRPESPEELYRLWLLAQQPPPVTAATLPALPFTLQQIESQEGLRMPAETRECQLLAWLAGWDYAGNPYHGSRPLKLRAFVLAAIDLVMLDYLYEHDPRGADRADYLGGNLIWIGFTYSIVKDVLSPEVRAAFEAGLHKLVMGHLNKWGPKGMMTDMDLFAPIGLWYVSQAVADPALKAVAAEYSRKLFTDEHYYHPAGYFVDNGCFDTSYNGISLYFGTWAALMTDWDFADEAMERAFRLRAHLCFPDPDGNFTGPSAMSSRTSGDPPRDQWQFAARTQASGMVADEALYLATLPDAAALEGAPARLAALYNAQLSTPVALKPGPWREGHWSGHINFPYENYRAGHYARLKKLQEEKSPLLKPLYQRGGEFVRAFERAFVIARLGASAFAIHTGPVGRPVGHGGRPYGYGGGALSIYWSPETGSVIAARRRGVQGAVFDLYDEWRSWPIHAVSGLSAGNELVSSSRIEQPEIVQELSKNSGTIGATGNMPKYDAQRSSTSPSGLDYERRFSFGKDGALTVVTRVRSAGAEKLAELYETIPLMVRETAAQAPSRIEFMIGDRAVEASGDAVKGVTAVRISRFTGSVHVRFARPQTVSLAPEWRDGFQTTAQCRNVLVDLLGAGARPVGKGVFAVEYTIAP